MSTARAGGKGSKEKPLKTPHSNTQNSRPDPQSTSSKNQPTAEQMRLAKMLTESEDADLQKKLKQITELTGSTIDVAMVALHDCNDDLNRAVVKLLENENDEGEWKEAGSKKKKNPPSSNKTNAAEPISNSVNHKSDKRHDKNKDREDDVSGDQDTERPERGGFGGPRGRRNDRAPPRFQRGRGRDHNDGDRNDSRSRDRPSGERGRGRGRGSASGGRGRGRGGSSATSGSRGGFGVRERQGFDKGPQIDTWTNETAEKENDGNIGAWTEDWSADEWTGPLDETKVFTASASSEPKMFSPPSPLANDNDAKVFESQVFNASCIPEANEDSSAAFGISGLGQDALGQGSLNSLGQNSIAQNAIGPGSMGQNSLRQSSLGQRLDLGMLLPKTANSSSTENGHSSQPSASSYLSQYAKEASETIKNAVGAGSASSNTSQQQYLSQYNKEATESIKNAVGIGTGSSSGSNSQQQTLVNSHTVSSAVSQNLMSNTPPPGLTNTAGTGTTSQRAPTSSSPAAANKQASRSKQPPPSKIPASAVVMPGGMNYRLDVQFGTLDFNGGQDPSSNIGFSVGGSSTDTGFNTTTSSAQPGLSNHQDHSSVTGLGGRGSSALDSMSQSQPATRGTVTGGVYQPNTSTPPKDFSSQNTLSASQQSSKISSPESMPYPGSQSERKSSPFSAQRSTPLTGGLSSGKTSTSVSQMSYSNQQSSSNTYNSYQYKSPPQQQNLVSAAASFSSPASTVGSSSQQYPPGTYQSSSFQSPATSYGVQSQSGSSGLYSSQSSSGAYQGQSVSSSYQSQSAYGGVSQSPGAGTSAYHSRDSSGGSQSASTFSNSASQSVSGSSPGPAYTGRGTSDTSSSSSAAPGSAYGNSGSTGSQFGVTSLQSGSMGAGKLTDSLNKMAVKDSGLEQGSSSSTNHYGVDGGSTVTSASSSSISSLAGSHAGVSSGLGLSGSSVSTTSSSTKTSGTTKPPPNLPPGVPLLPQNYMIGQPGMPFAAIPGLTQQAMPYTYEELQLLTQPRPVLPGYYDMPLQPATTLAAAAAAGGAPGGSTVPSAGRGDQSNLISAAAASAVNVPYTASESGSKLARMDAQSPVNVTSQIGSSQSLGGSGGGQPTAPIGGSGSTQSAGPQAFINPAGIPPNYSYYYHPVPGYSFTNLIQVPSVSNATHGGTTGSTPFQKQGYGSHAYGSAGQSQDFSKTYGGVTQTQSKGSVLAGGPSVTSSTVADITSPGYGGKTHSQSYEKGFHGATGTPPPFNLMPSAAATQAGAAALGQPAYAAAPYGIPIVAPTHQPHSQMLHHPIPDAAGGSSRGSQQANSAAKGVGSKAYSTGYWNN